MNDEEHDSRYTGLLRKHLPYAGSAFLEPSDELAPLGLDSLGMIRLLADLEEEFAVAFPDEHLTAETFATVGSLREVLAGLLPAEAQGSGESGEPEEPC